jgi:hypothetical protein
MFEELTFSYISSVNPVAIIFKALFMVMSVISFYCDSPVCSNVSTVVKYNLLLFNTIGTLGHKRKSQWKHNVKAVGIDLDAMRL